MTNTQETTYGYENGCEPKIITLAPQCSFSCGRRNRVTVVIECKSPTISPGYEIRNEQVTASPNSVSSALQLSCCRDVCATMGFRPTSAEITPSALELAGSKPSSSSSKEGRSSSREESQVVPAAWAFGLFLGLIGGGYIGYQCGYGSC
jgi:hypothetical protein